MDASPSRNKRLERAERFIRRVVRETVVEASIAHTELPPLVDEEAERELLSCALKGVIRKPFHELEPKHFYWLAHQKLWAMAEYPFEDIREELKGEDVRFFYDCLKERQPLPVEALRELAERVVELHEARTLVAMFRRLDAQLRLGAIQVCDAERELLLHFQRGLTDAW